MASIIGTMMAEIVFWFVRLSPPLMAPGAVRLGGEISGLGGQRFRK
jgi:hypothetical protein